MKTISITPQNHFKKIQKRVYHRDLDMNNTSWVHGFNSWLKYELFHAKIITSHEPRLFYEKIGCLPIKQSKQSLSNEFIDESIDKSVLMSNPIAMSLFKSLKAK